MQIYIVSVLSPRPRTSTFLMRLLWTDWIEKSSFWKTSKFLLCSKEAILAPPLPLKPAFLWLAAPHKQRSAKGCGFGAWYNHIRNLQSVWHNRGPRIEKTVRNSLYQVLNSPPRGARGNRCRVSFGLKCTFLLKTVLAVREPAHTFLITQILVFKSSI